MTNPKIALEQAIATAIVDHLGLKFGNISVEDATTIDNLTQCLSEVLKKYVK